MKKLLLAIITIVAILLASCATQSKRDRNYPYAWRDIHNNHNDAYYYTDRFGHKVSQKRFSVARQFAPNGLAAVCESGLSGKWGYVNTTIDLVIPYQYDFASDFGDFGFDDDLACVKFNLDEANRLRQPSVAFGPAMIIDTKGRQVSKIYGCMFPNNTPEARCVTIVNSGTCFHSTKGYQDYSTDGYWGAIDSRGKEIIPCIYEFLITHSSLSGFIVRHEGKWGAIDYRGKELIPCEYDGAFYNDENSHFNTFTEVDGDNWNHWSEEDVQRQLCFIKGNRIAIRLSASN